MRILITGAGFIASHVTPLLQAEGHDVTLLDRNQGMSEASWRNGCRFVVGDVSDSTFISKLVNEHDAVLHLAGLLGTAETIDDPYPSVQTNIVGALNVLEACMPRVGRTDGTSGVIITVGNYFMLNTYSITKTTAERFALMYNREHGTRVAVVRAYNAYGERQKHKPIRKLLPNCIAAALKGRPIEVFGSGEQKIDMISVRDVAKVLARALLHPHGTYDRILEAGTGRAVTVNEVVELVNQECGNGASIHRQPMRPGEPLLSVVVADPTTLQVLGLNPEEFTPWERGVPLTIEWYRAHPDFLED